MATLNKIILFSVIILACAPKNLAQTYKHDPLKYQQIEAMELGSGSLSDAYYTLHSSYRQWANSQAKSLYRIETLAMDKKQFEDALIVDSVFQARAEVEGWLMADRLANISGAFEKQKLESVLQSIKDKKTRLDVIMPDSDLARQWGRTISMYEIAMKSLDAYNPNSERQMQYEQSIYAHMLRSNQQLSDVLTAQEARVKADVVLRGSKKLSPPSKKTYARSAILRWREHAWKASASLQSSTDKDNK